MCEVELRKMEWNMMTEDEKAKNPNYTDVTEVEKAFKKHNRGKNWNATASTLRPAKQEIAAEESASSDTTSVKRRKAAILQRAKMLAEAILEAFKAGNMFGALGTAGARVIERENTEQEYQRRYDAYINDPTDPEKKRALDEIEEQYEAQGDYLTLKEKGDEQAAYLKA